MMRFWRMFCAACVLGVTPATAAAPQGILDKTVTMSWSTSGTGKRADGTTVSFANQNSRIVYISSAGRPFLRMQVRGRKASRQGVFQPTFKEMPVTLALSPSDGKREICPI